MNTNFNETYQSLSTAELLNIVKKTNDYQPEAVLAAIALLKERAITHEDHMEAERMATNTTHGWMDERKVLNAISTRIEDLVEPIVSPETEINPQKWINILMMTLGVYSIWILTKMIIRWRTYNRAAFSDFSEITEPLYLLITIGGLYSKKKWGWRLLMIYCILQTLSSSYGLFLVIKSHYLGKYLGGALAWTLVGAVAIYLLSRKESRTHFDVGEYYLRNTVFAAIIVFLLIMVFYKYFPILI